MSEMKKFVLVGLFSVSVCVASAESLAQFIKSTEGKYDKAIQNADIAAFEKLMKENSTADFVYIEKGAPTSKPMNRDQMLATMAQSFKGMGKVDKVESKTLSVKEKGDTGVAITTHTITNSAKGPNDKQAKVMVYVGKSMDEYKRAGGKWKLTKMTWIETKMMIDGKPVGG
jgi:hypothetical protein